MFRNIFLPALATFLLALATIAEGGENMRLKISVPEGEIAGSLEDNPVTRQLLLHNPMTLEMKDFNHSEKIAMPAEKLNTQNASMGLEPKAGDVAVYAPWGNLCIFYRDAPFSDGLIYLGRITSGLDILAGEKGNFKATWHITSGLPENGQSK